MSEESCVPTGDGASLWTATSGAGPPMVLCHGGPGLWDYLGPVADAVDDLVTVHRWDQRGCGRSTGSGPYTLEQFVADLETVREHFGHERWAVGGHSWGARLALQYAVVHPDRVTALVYLSGTGLGTAWKDAYHDEVQRRLTDEQHRRRRELENRDRNDDEEREYRVLSWASDYADVDRGVELAAEMAAAPFPINEECNAALNAEVDARSEADDLDRCRTLDVPTIVMHGAEDPRPVGAVERLVDVLPDAELHVISNAGHLPWQENPDGFARALRPFLTQRTSASN